MSCWIIQPFCLFIQTITFLVQKYSLGTEVRLSGVTFKCLVQPTLELMPAMLLFL